MSAGYDDLDEAMRDRFFCKTNGSANHNMKSMTTDDIMSKVRENFEHHFKVTDAKRYGITEAILLYNIKFWIAKNKANRKHFHNGRTWTYNWYKAFKALFPYLSESQIKRALASLVKQEAILKNNFNKKRYDRTNWYAIADESELPIATGNDQRKRTAAMDDAANYNGRSRPFHRTNASHLYQILKHR